MTSSAPWQQTGAFFPELAAVARHLRDNPRLAASGARELLRRYPGEPHALMLLVAAWRMAGDLRAARNMLQALARTHPQLAAIQYEAAAISSELGEHESARDAFLRVAALEPEHPQAWGRLGDELVRTGRKDEAREAYVRHAQIRAARAQRILNT